MSLLILKILEDARGYNILWRQVKFPQAAYKRLEIVVKENNEMNQNVNLFKGRKKLKFMDDSQDIDYVSVLLFVERKVHPLTDHEREVKRAQGRGIKTYTDVDFSQGKWNDSFLAGGDGLPHCVVENLLAPVQQITKLYSLGTHTVIENSMHTSEQAVVGHDSKRYGRKSVKDADTLLRVLCHRSDREASKFLKKQYKFPKSAG